LESDHLFIRQRSHGDSTHGRRFRPHLLEPGHGRVVGVVEELLDLGRRQLACPNTSLRQDARYLLMLLEQLLMHLISRWPTPDSLNGWLGKRNNHVESPVLDLLVLHEAPHLGPLLG